MPPLPPRPVDRLKLWIWRHIVYPVFPYVRDGLLALGVLKHDGRQDWHIGWLDPTKDVEAFLAHLERKGFHNHFVAWEDTGQIMSLRRHEGFTHQYHLRIFADGEIRGHYEKTPESNPIQHFRSEGAEVRLDDFLGWLDDWIVAQPPATSFALGPIAFGGRTRSHRTPATSRGVPEKG